MTNEELLSLYAWQDTTDPVECARLALACMQSRLTTRAMLDAGLKCIHGAPSHGGRSESRRKRRGDDTSDAKMHIERIEGGLLVTVSYDWRAYQYRRVNGAWQMLSTNGNWFDCTLHDPDVERCVADYETPLRCYGLDEGPDYPRANKKGDVTGFFRKLQARELAACTKGIFAPLPKSVLKYDAARENLARHQREAKAALYADPDGQSQRRPWQKMYEATMRGEAVPHSMNCGDSL